ncbi:hypothetical protein V2J09_020597 [Rumex salicifolius]
MGNALGRSKRKTAKVMKINGETTRVKTPVQAKEITDHHPGHVLMDSESVKHFGIRASPLGPAHFLEPKRLYFLVELPKLPDDDHHKAPRRVRSGEIHVSAKDRLESLMLSRRSVSDLSSIRRNKAADVAAGPASTVRMRLPRAEVERLMRQSRDEDEAAQKIVGLCMGNSGPVQKWTGSAPGLKGKKVEFDLWGHQEPVPQVRMEKSPLGLGDAYSKKRVGFLPVNEIAEIGLTVESR